MKAYTFTAAINAYALYKASEKLGISLFTTQKIPKLPIPYQQQNTEQAWLLFTEEHSLKAALHGVLKGQFLPCHFSSMLLDDKSAFAEWLLSQKNLTPGLKHWPIEQQTEVTFPCLLKAKHSWIGTEKLPRGWVCHDSDMLRKALSTLDQADLNREHFFIQEWLGGKDTRIISVCGFHDAQDHKRNLTAVVERIAPQQQELSCSAMIETIEDEWGLQEKKQLILNALAFNGPYEMEFLITQNRVCVLELNPRFWLQHSIFIPQGNGLLKRYYQLDSIADRQLSPVQDIVWVDGLHLLRSLLYFRRDIIFLCVKKRFFQHKKVLIWPNPWIASGYYLRLFWHRKLAPLLNHYRHR